MGYKLAGFNVMGGVEIDKRMMSVYRANHGGGSLSFEMGVQEFNRLPLSQVRPTITGIDVLDGSPPCSTFSMSGNREKDWGKERVFKEGQASQVLSDLFFDFIETAVKLQPKVVVSENVKGMLLGSAKWYVKQVFEKFRAAGYETQLFLLDASLMGVPQARERVFFISRRADLNIPKVDLNFNEKRIGIASAMVGLSREDLADGIPLTKMAKVLWGRTMPGAGLNEAHPRKSWFAHRRPNPAHPMQTIIGGTPSYHWSESRYLSTREIGRGQTFPDDYDYGGFKAQYLCGMSVPPFMMQRVALRVAEALLASRAASGPSPRPSPS